MRILRIVDYNPMCNENTADVIIGHFALASTSAANLWGIDEGGFHRDRKAAFMATLYDIEMAVLPSQMMLLATGRKTKLFTRAHPRERVREILKKLPRSLPSYFLPARPGPISMRSFILLLRKISVSLLPKSFHGWRSSAGTSPRICSETDNPRELEFDNVRARKGVPTREKTFLRNGRPGGRKGLDNFESLFPRSLRFDEYEHDRIEFSFLIN